MKILIGTDDITNRVPYETLRIDNILTQQVDRCTFTINNSSANIYKPAVGREVVITDDLLNIIFAGVITRRRDVSSGFGFVNFEVECSDYTRLLDQKLVAETYENMTAGEIIDDLILNFAPSGFTTTQVDCNLTVSYIQFKYEPVSACIKQIADLFGFDWYVDYEMDLYFKAPSATPAPFDLEDNTGKYIDGTLQIRRDNSQLRTSIIVRGGEYLGSEFTASVRADGKQTTFNLPYKYSDFKATLTGHPLTIGIDYIDSPDNYDALYNFTEKVLKFKEEDRPSLNATLSFGGKPHLPVITKFKDPVAVAAIFSAEGFGDGEYEYLILDKSINSQVAARQRAAAEIQSYGATISEGDFETEESGLIAGMQMHVISVARHIDDYFVINKVTTTMDGPTKFKYKVSLVTTKTMDYLAILKKLIMRDNKNIEIRDTDTLDLIESSSESIGITDSVSTGQPHPRLTESMSMNETFTAQSKNWPVKWVLGPQTPSGFKRVFILNGSKLS